MTEETDPIRPNNTCFIEVSPSEVDAGTDLTLRGRVSTVPPEDLRGNALTIKDQAGVLIEHLDLAEFNGVINETRECVVKAPLQTGNHTWVAINPAPTTPGTAPETTSTPFSFTVKPHDTRVVVWDLPSAIESGDHFRVKVGVKCSSQCQASNWEVEVSDHDERRQARATLDDTPWPGTDALFFTEVTLTAPVDPGLYTWTTKAPLDEVNIAHTEGVAHFGVRVVPKHECLLTVVAIDKERQIPIKGAKVSVHPYRAVTNERGVAEIKVPKGPYRLFVSGKDYFPFRNDGQIETDHKIKAELSVDLGLSDADVWS